MGLPGIELNFGSLVLEAELFATPVAQRFAEHLPYTIKLVQWGNELYGPIGHDLGVHAPVSEIPPGGIAYTVQGGYLCVFFGQQPAWPVEHIGMIHGSGWKELLRVESFSTVKVSAKT